LLELNTRLTPYFRNFGTSLLLFPSSYILILQDEEEVEKKHRSSGSGEKMEKGLVT
jgi:hypothetical protein